MRETPFQRKSFFPLPRAVPVSCLVLLVCGAASANLIENGSLDGFANGKFDGWAVAPPADAEGVSAVGKLDVDTEVAVAGSTGSARFAFQGAGAFHLSLRRPATVSPAGKYRLTLHARSEGGPVRIEAQLRLLRTDITPPKPVRTVPLDFEATEEWATKTIEVDVADSEPLAAVHIRLRNPRPNPVTLWLDEVTLEAL